MTDGSRRRMNEAPLEVREAYEKMQRGASGGTLKLLADTPNLLKDFLSHYGIVGQSIPRRVYEMVYIRISATNQCHSCLRLHLASAKRIGMVPAEWEALQAGDYVQFSPEEQAALLFADKLTSEPDSVTDADFATLKRFFSAEQFVDLDVLVELFDATTRPAKVTES